MTMIGLRDLASNLVRMKGWTNGSRTSPRAPSRHWKSLAVFFQIERPRVNRRLALRINKAMCGPRIWDSTHPLCLLSITSFAVFPAVR